VKLAPKGYFDNILRAAFSTISIYKKKKLQTQTARTYRKAGQNMFAPKS